MLLATSIPIAFSLLRGHRCIHQTIRGTLATLLCEACQSIPGRAGGPYEYTLILRPDMDAHIDPNIARLFLQGHLSSELEPPPNLQKQPYGIMGPSSPG